MGYIIILIQTLVNKQVYTTLTAHLTRLLKQNILHANQSEKSHSVLLRHLLKMHFTGMFTVVFWIFQPEGEMFLRWSEVGPRQPEVQAHSTRSFGQAKTREASAPRELELNTPSLFRMMC